MSLPTLPPGAVPPDYTEVLYWKLTQTWRVIALNLLSLPLMAVFGAVFFLFVSLFGPPGEVSFRVSPWAVLLLPFGPLLVLCLHEWAHGLAMQAYGARPQYGFSWKGLVFYATAPGYAFRRNHYLVIALAPLVSLSVLACLGIWLLAGSVVSWLFAAAGALNGGGAIGDLWMSAIVLRYPAEAYIIDERDGMRIFLPETAGKTG